MSSLLTRAFSSGDRCSNCIAGFAFLNIDDKPIVFTPEIVTEYGDERHQMQI